MEIRDIRIVMDYKANIPLEIIARIHKCSLHYVLKIIHANMTGEAK